MKKVEMIKWFYIDIGLYVVINLGLFLLNILTTPDNLWFYWVTAGLGNWACGARGSCL